ncbi:MAG: hypothetical protein ACSHW1_09125 [Yoonia sp.]
MAQDPKPIIPNQNMTRAQRRRCGQEFKNQTIKALGHVIKGTGWRRKSAWVFQVQDDWYLTAFVTGGTTSDGLSNRLKVELGIKPMAVDPVNWRAHGLHDNIGRPASFRSDAAFKVSALLIALREWTEGLTDPDKAAVLVFDGITEMAKDALQAVASKPFSALVTDSPHGEKYQGLLWASLIAEGKKEQAIEAIKAHYVRQDPGALQWPSLTSLLDRYQQVIDGTDTSGYRSLSISINGTPNLYPPR